MLTQGVVGPQVVGDGQSPGGTRLARQGDTIVSELHGKYAEQNIRGNVFKGLSASAGIAIILPATGGGHPTLFNPLGSGVWVSVIRLSLTYVSGTMAPGALEWASTLNAGSTFGTGAPIVTATFVTPTTGVVGGSGKAKALWAPTVNTFTAAPVFLEGIGVGLDTEAAASTGAPVPINIDYDGMLIVAPGAAISLCNQTTTTTALFQVMVAWEEIPQ